MEARAAQWLSDTWSLAVQSPHTWRKLHSGCSILLQLLYSIAIAGSLHTYVCPNGHDQCAADGVDAAAAAKEYSRRNTPAAPCGRYGASAVVYKQQMWLFGGTDGGFSKKGRDKSKPGKIASLPETSSVRVLCYAVLGNLKGATVSIWHFMYPLALDAILCAILGPLPGSNACTLRLLVRLQHQMCRGNSGRSACRS